METIFVRPKGVKRDWFVVDAAGKPLGRIAAKVASVLRGKHKPIFVPHQEVGDFVIVVNAEKAVLTGRKAKEKTYFRYSGYPGGMTGETYEEVIARKPAFPMETAIRGMLPKNKLGRKLFGNVKVYAGESHPHAAQQPRVLDI